MPKAKKPAKSAQNRQKPSCSQAATAVRQANVSDSKKVQERFSGKLGPGFTSTQITTIEDPDQVEMFGGTIWSGSYE